MTEAAFLDFLGKLSGLTAEMVSAFKRMAGRLTDDQRAEAAEKLETMDADIVAAMDKYEADIKDADRQFAKVEKSITALDEKDEESQDLAVAEDKLTQA